MTYVISSDTGDYRLRVRVWIRVMVFHLLLVPLIFNYRLKTVTEELVATRQFKDKYEKDIADKDLKITELEGRMKFFENKYHSADELSKQYQKCIEDLKDTVEHNTIVSKHVIINVVSTFFYLCK